MIAPRNRINAYVKHWFRISKEIYALSYFSGWFNVLKPETYLAPFSFNKEKRIPTIRNKTPRTIHAINPIFIISSFRINCITSFFWNNFLIFTFIFILELPLTKKWCILCVWTLQDIITFTLNSPEKSHMYTMVIFKFQGIQKAFLLRNAFFNI